MKRSKSYLGFGLAAILALVAVTFFLADQIQTTSAVGGGPEMKLTAGGCAADCTFANDEKFTLVVEIVSGPDTGYTAAQSFVEYGTDLVYDVNAVPAADEIVWPDCVSAVALQGQIGPTDFLHGCLTGLLPPLTVSTYVGNFLEISMTCSSGNSTTEVQLLPVGDPLAGDNGAGFLEPDESVAVAAKVSNLSITCGAGPPDATPTPPDPTDTPTPMATAGPTATTGPTATAGPTDTPAPATDTPVPPTVTPTPDQVCGDIDGDGMVTSLDALWVLWFNAGLVGPIVGGDINGDGVIDSRDALLILQIEADLYMCA